MQDHVKPADSEPIGQPDPKPVIRFIDVQKTFRFHGARPIDDEDEEGIEEATDEEEEEGEHKLKPGETRIALQNINLSILSGERVGIIGANGCGKSTLLSIVSGMSHPSGGRVIGRGSVVPLNHVARPLNGKWSGLRNLRVLARLLGFPAEIIDERCTEIARFAGMDETILQPVATYSRNMYARLAFAAALELDGDIYVSDDILGVGDQAYQAKCFQRLEKLCEFGKTLLFATHKLKLIEQLCTRAVWLHRGQIRADSEPAKVIAQYLAGAIAERGGEEGKDANSISTWFRQKYGRDYPLPAPEIHELTPIPPDGNEEPKRLPSEECDPGGIVSLELTSKVGLQGVVEDNAVFFVRAHVNVPKQDITVDLMLEITTGKLPIYQSFLSEPAFARGPQELVIDIAVDSSRLPDNVYRLELRALLTLAESGRRFISKGHMFVATKNCRPQGLERAGAFVSEWPPDRSPLGTLELDWLVRPKDPEGVAKIEVARAS